MKILVNKSFGRFNVSKAVYDELGIKWDGYGYLKNEHLGIESDNYLACRIDTRFISAVEKIGEHASSGREARIQVIEIPEGIQWEIDDYDGFETIHEVHRSW